MEKTLHPLAARGEFSPLDFRATLGHFASGITIVSGMHDGEPVGMTCQSFFSQSIDPPLVSFSVMETSTTYPKLRTAGRFCVNVLSESQQHVSAQFGRSSGDKWAGIQWKSTMGGNPVIDDTVMWVDCELEDELVAGDHIIVVARVVEMSPMEHAAREPLVFFRGAYRRLAESFDNRATLQA